MGLLLAVCSGTYILSPSIALLWQSYNDVALEDEPTDSEVVGFLVVKLVIPPKEKNGQEMEHPQVILADDGVHCNKF
jgi:hypothetical protein